jgi:hypothetical protein
MVKDDETPRTNPAEIECLIEQIRGTNLDPRAKEKIERLLRTVLTLVELLKRKNTSIKKLCEMIRSEPCSPELRTQVVDAIQKERTGSNRQ